MPIHRHHWLGGRASLAHVTFLCPDQGQYYGLMPTYRVCRYLAHVSHCILVMGAGSIQYFTKFVSYPNEVDFA